MTTVTESPEQAAAREGAMTAADEINDAYVQVQEILAWQAKHVGDPMNDQALETLKSTISGLQRAKYKADRNWAHQRNLATKEEQEQRWQDLERLHQEATVAVKGYEAALIKAVEQAVAAQPLITKYKQLAAAIEAYAGTSAVTWPTPALKTPNLGTVLSADDPVTVLKNGFTSPPHMMDQVLGR